jgi:hypothetical protein
LITQLEDWLQFCKVEGQGAQEWDTTIEETIGDIIANKNEDLKKGETTIGS